MTDRITRAWQLRCAIHATVSTHPRCTMAEIFAALPDTNTHTLRRAIQRMRHDGDIAVTSHKGNVGRYLAITDAVVPHQTVRRNMGKGGKITQAIASAKWSQLCQQKKFNKFQVAERMRASALEFLNANPGAPMRALLNHMDARGIESDKERVSQLLCRMERLGEVTREARGAISPLDGNRCSAWYALTDKTITAAEMLEHISTNTSKRHTDRARSMGERRAEIEQQRIDAERLATGITVTVGAKTTHRGNDRSHPLPSSGQGCVRQTPAISLNQLY